MWAKGRGRKIEVKDPMRSRIQENLGPLRAIPLGGDALDEKL